MTDFAETEISPEYAAECRRRAVIEYMGVSPQVHVGAIPEEKMLDWREALNVPDPAPSEIWAAGWLDAELAMRYSLVDGLSDDEPSEDEPDVLGQKIAALLMLAHEKLLRVRNHESMQVTSLLRSQAALAAAAMPVWADIILDQGASVASAKYMAEQAKSAAYLMEYFAENPSVEASMWADTLTFISVISMRDQMIAFPCPPRLTSPYIDNFHRQSAVLFSENSFWPVRVGSAGATSSIHVPYQLLGHEGYAGHRLGTLHAAKQLEQAMQLHRTGQVWQVQAMLPSINSAQHHLEEVYNQVASCIHVEQQRGEQWRDEPDDPREWVAALQPGRNPYLVNPEMTDAAISPLELQVLDETISAPDAIELGWLYTEVAFGRAIDPTVSVAQIKGDIDRAEEIFSLALEKTDESDVLQFCEASLAHSVAWMQRIILCNEPLRPEDFDYYRQALLFTGQRASDRYAQLSPNGPEAIALEALMRRITLCLLTIHEGDGIIPLFTPPRQRSEGWDTTVWSQTLDGFMPGQYGRLRITAQEDPSSLSDGIVTVTHQHLGFGSKSKPPKKGAAVFRVFEAITGEVAGVQSPKKGGGHDARRIIQKAWQALEARIAATEV